MTTSNPTITATITTGERQAAKPAPVALVAPVATVRIYGLCDPRTGQLRYIGRTVVTLPRRLTQHRHCRSHDGRRKVEWMRELQSAGTCPEIFLIEEVGAGENWRDAERFHIEYFRFIGCDLVNTAPGGSGPEFTPEMRATLSASGKRRDPATRTLPPRQSVRRIAAVGA